MVWARRPVSVPSFPSVGGSMSSMAVSAGRFLDSTSTCIDSLCSSIDGTEPLAAVERSRFPARAVSSYPYEALSGYRLSTHTTSA